MDATVAPARPEKAQVRYLKAARESVMDFMEVVGTTGMRALADMERRPAWYTGVSAAMFARAAAAARDNGPQLGAHHLLQKKLMSLSQMKAAYDRTVDLGNRFLTAADGLHPDVAKDYGTSSDVAKKFIAAQTAASDAIRTSDVYDGNFAMLLGSECATCSVGKPIGIGNNTGLPFCSEKCMVAYD